MNNSVLASGDTQIEEPSCENRSFDKDNGDKYLEKDVDVSVVKHSDDKRRKVEDWHDLINETDAVKNQETNLKERITQCKKLIESLKNDFREEKMKIQTEVKVTDETCSQLSEESSILEDLPELNYSGDEISKEIDTVNTLNMDSKFDSDSSIVEYEKQLEKYQQTLNIAQMEKKNAIKREMMMKAFNLKLMEVENQCNIELMKVKQNLKCLEPLHILARKWKAEKDEQSGSSLNVYNMLSRFPELPTFYSTSIDVPTKDLRLKSDEEQSTDITKVSNTTITID